MFYLVTNPHLHWNVLEMQNLQISIQILYNTWRLTKCVDEINWSPKECKNKLSDS